MTTLLVFLGGVVFCLVMQVVVPVVAYLSRSVTERGPSALTGLPRPSGSWRPRRKSHGE